MGQKLSFSIIREILKQILLHDYTLLTILSFVRGATTKILNMNMIIFCSDVFDAYLMLFKNLSISDQIHGYYDTELNDTFTTIDLRPTRGST